MSPRCHMLTAYRYHLWLLAKIAKAHPYGKNPAGFCSISCLLHSVVLAVREASGVVRVSLCTDQVKVLPFNALVLWLSLLMVISSVNTDKPEEKIYSCPVIQCSAPAVNGLPGREGRDGRDGPKGEKGEPVLILKNIKSIGKNVFVSTGKENTFDSGKSLCAKAGSTLASPRNEAENTALKDLIRPSKQAYMGISDEQTEGRFMYLNGGAVTYRNWNAGEPNNLKNEDCAVIQDSGKWNYINCSNSCALIICEFLS
ncbi:mannose-binding protein-like [Theristicus caerulescens]